MGMSVFSMFVSDCLELATDMKIELVTMVYSLWAGGAGKLKTDRSVTSY